MSSTPSSSKHAVAVRRSARPRAAVTLGLVVAAVMLASFAVAVALDVPVLTDERPRLGAGGPGAAIAGTSLLTVDALVPVPSSGVMIGLGALFGLAGGAALSLAGSVGAALLGWWIGRRGGRWYERFAGSQGAGRPAGRFDRGGLVAIITSRPVPVLAETVAIVAGASGMPARQVLLGAAVGSLAPALAYGAVGAAASEAHVALPVVAAVVVLAGGAWVVAARRPVTTT